MDFVHSCGIVNMSSYMKKNVKVWNIHNIKNGRILIMVLTKWNEIVKLISKEKIIKYNNLITSTDY